MTQGPGEMREVYPVSSDVYRYRTKEIQGRFNFELEGDLPEGMPPAIAFSVESRETGEGLCRTESGETHAFAWARVGPELHLWLDGALFVFQRPDPSSGQARRRGGTGGTEVPNDILAPMPGAVLQVLVNEGDQVERNQTVVIMESMKMELVITAPRAGVVGRVSVQEGQRVERGMRLLEMAPEGDAGNC